MLPIIRIGEKWANSITVAYLSWVAKIEPNPPYVTWEPFDPTYYISGAVYEAAAFQAGELQDLFSLEAALKLKSEFAEPWIKEFAAAEIKYIDDANRAAIKHVLLQGWQQDLTPAEQARMIRPFIGLTPNQSIALQNYMESLGLEDEALIWHLGERYGQQLLNFRAETIALTEGMTAANAGWRLENEDAVDRGVLDPDKYEQEWLAAEDDRTCDECSEMEGERAPIGDLFSDGSAGPPVHPRCRCTTIIVEVD